MENNKPRKTIPQFSCNYCTHKGVCKYKDIQMEFITRLYPQLIESEEFEPVFVPCPMVDTEDLTVEELKKQIDDRDEEIERLHGICNQQNKDAERVERVMQMLSDDRDKARDKCKDLESQLSIQAEFDRSQIAKRDEEIAYLKRSNEQLAKEKVDLWNEVQKLREDEKDA